MTSAHSPDRLAHADDETGAAYVRLALAIEQHRPGYIDAYFGPVEWKTRSEAEGKRPLADLSAQALSLAHSIGGGAVDSQRRRFLAKQVTAMQTSLRIVAGTTMPYLDEVRQLYDVSPARVDESNLEEARRTLETLLPGHGTLNERLRERRRHFQIGQEAAAELFEIASAETRRRTRRLFDLPENEAVDVKFVGDKPWGAYNWYLGNAHSLVEINTDSPFQANGVVGMMAHEAYPGHHTEHAIKEHVIYKGQRWPEASVLLINAPECVVSEGIATKALDVIFAEGEAERWQRAELYPRSGVRDDLSSEEVDQLSKAQRALAAVSDNAALMLHVDGRPVEEVIAYFLKFSGRTRQEAERGIRFLTDPLWRSYTFTYSMGHALLESIFRQHEPTAVFRRLLTEPLTPDDLAAWPGEVGARWSRG